MADVTRRDRGMVTAELAVIIPFGLAFAMLLLWVISLGITQVRLVDAAREAARMVARGDSVAAATELAEHDAPRGADVTMRTRQGLVTVTIKATSGVPIPFFAHVGARTMTATAVAAQEAP